MRTGNQPVMNTERSAQWRKRNHPSAIYHLAASITPCRTKGFEASSGRTWWWWFPSFLPSFLHGKDEGKAAGWNPWNPSRGGWGTNAERMTQNHFEFGTIWTAYILRDEKVVRFGTFVHLRHLPSERDEDTDFCLVRDDGIMRWGKAFRYVSYCIGIGRMRCALLTDNEHVPHA